MSLQHYRYASPLYDVIMELAIGMYVCKNRKDG
jgi:hypothetical protein